MIAIVDYGAGNIFSVQNMLKKLGIPSTIASNDLAIENADKLILPGVGAFDTCALALQQSGLQQALNKKVIIDKTPVLGICVGMQLMTEASDEGSLPGLGWIKGKAVRFKKENMTADLKIPHMGWADVEPKKASFLLEGMYEAPRFYFVHSFYVLPGNENDVLLCATHGNSFAAALECDNITAVQFHPEKSHKYGMKLLENFAKKY